MKLDRDTAQTIAYQEKSDRYLHIREENAGETRWGVVRRTIFMDREDGNFYALEWEQGATESQDYDDFDYDGKSEFEADLVVPVKVTVTEYHKP